MALVADRSIEDPEGVSDVISTFLQYKEGDDRGENLAQACSVVVRAILAYAQGMGHSLTLSNEVDQQGKPDMPSPVALERLFWRTLEDAEFMVSVSGRYPAFQGCFLPIRGEFHGVQSNLGVVLWAAENSLSDLDDDELGVVESSYRYVCDALSPIRSELLTCLRMAVRQMEQQPWAPVDRKNRGDDAEQAVRAVLEGSLFKGAPPQGDRLLDEEPEAIWRHEIYPQLCGLALVGLCLNDERWKDSTELVMALNMDPKIRVSIVIMLVNSIPTMKDLLDFSAYVEEHTPANEKAEVYKTIGNVLCARSLQVDYPDSE